MSGIHRPTEKKGTEKARKRTSSLEPFTYESVAWTAGVPVAVNPVVSLPTPGPVSDELVTGANQHILHHQVRSHIHIYINEAQLYNS